MSISQKEIFEKLLQDGKVSVTFIFDAPKVIIPEYIKENIRSKVSYLIFDYGLDLPNPIPDLEIKESGILATLSFDRTPYKTFVPWESIIGISNKDVFVTWAVTLKEAVSLSTKEVPPPKEINEFSNGSPTLKFDKPKLKLV